MEDHKLVAIMFTDVVGYTALMADDEAAAYQLLKKNRKIQKPIIEKHKGKWLKEIGDGVLASFETVTDAVCCAIEIQDACLDVPDLKLRIGIHQGEVIVEDEDVFGDGVNIASRIEPLAPAGGIYVSESVYRNIENKKGIHARYVKEETLKNVKHPVRIYEVDVKASRPVILNKGTSDIGPDPVSGSNIWRKPIFLISLVGIAVIMAYLVYANWDKDRTISELTEFESAQKSIAVLPFRNDSPDNENVYFCNGIMEGILDHLSKIPDLSVVSRTSVEQYRDNPASVAEIAQKLGVNYILEGSVLRVGEQAKISAQLIYAPEDRHLWSKQFDKEVKDIFIVLSEVTQTIANDLKATISPELLDRIESVPTTSTQAYDSYLKGREYLYRYSQSGRRIYATNSEEQYKLAIETDSTFALAYAGLAQLIWIRDQYNFYRNQRSLDSVLMLCNKAIALDKNSEEAYAVRGAFYDHIMIELDKAEIDYEKAVELNPSHLIAIRDFALFIALHRRDYPSALKLLRRAEEIDRSPEELTITYANKVFLYNSIGAWDKLLEFWRKAKELNPLYSDYPIYYLESKGLFREIIDLVNKNFNNGQQGTLYKLGSSYLMLGEYDQALEYFKKWEKSIELEGEITPEAVTGWHRYGQALAGVGREKEGLQMMRNQLAKNDTIRNFQNTRYIYYDNAGICAFLGEKERAYEYLNKFDESKHRWDNLIYFVQFDPLYDNIRNDPEFIKITRMVLEEHQKIRDEIARQESIGEI